MDKQIKDSHLYRKEYDIGMSPKHSPTPKLVAPVVPSLFRYSQSSVEYDSGMSPKYSPKSK